MKPVIEQRKSPKSNLLFWTIIHSFLLVFFAIIAGLTPIVFSYIGAHAEWAWTKPRQEPPVALGVFLSWALIQAASIVATTASWQKAKHWWDKYVKFVDWEINQYKEENECPINYRKSA